MNRTIAAVVLLAAVLLGAVGSSALLRRQTDELIELAGQALKDEARAPELVEAWEKRQTAFSVFLGHNHFESLNGSVRVLPYLTREEYRKACAETIVKLEELKSHISFSLKNLF